MVNFGIVKTQVSQMLGEHYLNNQHETAESIYREYMRTVRNSPVLMLEYIVFKNLERKGVMRESAYKYIDDNVSLLKQFSKKDILAENQKLDKFHQDIKLSWEDKLLFENIQTLILESAGGNKAPNITRLHDSLSYVMESVMDEKETKGKKKGKMPFGLYSYINRKDKDDDEKEEEEENEGGDEAGGIDESILEGFELEDTFRVAIQHFNEKYAHLSEEERSIIYMLNENNESNKRDFFAGMKKKVIDVIKDTTGDPELREQGINEIKSREFNTETLVEDILEMYELIH